jgi:hypothetical protein
MDLNTLYLLAKNMTRDEFVKEVDYRMSGTLKTIVSKYDYVLVRVEKLKESSTPSESESNQT